MNLQNKIPAAALAVAGFAAVVAQVVLIRELLVVSSGNEIALGWFLTAWLLWTAAGSSLAGWWMRRPGRHRLRLAGLFATAAISLPLTLGLVRLSGEVFPTVVGEIPGPVHLLLVALASLSLFCLVSGAIFAVGSRYLAEFAGHALSAGTGRAYLFESLGSAAGGILTSLILIRLFSPFHLALWLSALYLLTAVLLTGCLASLRPSFLSFILLTIVLNSVIAIPRAGAYLESATRTALWPNYKVVDHRQSPYGDLTVVDADGSKMLLQNGLIDFTDSDPEAAEETVHYA